MKSVAILGCGPAGMMVAHAANLNGWDFRIYSKKQKSQLFGAQYLHEPIPGVTTPGDPGVMLSYRLKGTPESYRHKVYGPSWDGNTSPEDYAGDHPAWDLRAAYDKMWFDYGCEITNLILDGFAKQLRLKERKHFNKYDLVISTVPRTVWDDNNEHFKRTNIWALGDGDYERVHLHRPDPFTVECDGRPNVKWYRVSNIFGYCTMEWPQWWNTPYASVTPPARGAALVAKPLAYTGNAAPDFIHLGRYAQWTKGVLTSDVFTMAMEVLARDKVG